MKAYIVKVAEEFVPFDRPASSIEFGKEDLGSRLRRQVKAAGYQIEEVQSLEKLASLQVDAESLVLQDNLILSDGFLRDMLAQVPTRLRNLQCLVDVSKSPLLVEAAAEPHWKSIPIYYIGQGQVFGDAVFDKIELRWRDEYTLSHGLPNQMNQLHDLRIVFRNAFAHELVHWFDLQTAAGLYSREFVSNTVSLARRFLPNKLVDLILRWPWFNERCNRIGKNCKIHSSAILEGCVIGDNVEIGPNTYLQASVVADGATLRENTTLKMSYIGPSAFLMGSNVVNSYVGEQCSIIAPMLYNVVLGKGSFLSGGTGFADFNAGSGQVTTTIKGENIPSGLSSLGSCVGENCFIGANMVFAPGRVIPNDSHFLDNGLIRDVPTDPGGTYILSNNTFLQIPNSFIGAVS